MRKLAIALILAAVASGVSALACNSGKPFMARLPQEDRDAYLAGLQAAQASSTPVDLADEDTVPPAPPPPLFIQADPLSPPSLWSDASDTPLPEDAQPIQLEEVVVIS